MDKFRLLMVDDQPVEVERLRAEIMAHVDEVEEVVGVQHAAAAVEALQQKTFHLVLMDQQWSPSNVEAAQLVDVDGNLPPRGQVDWDRQGFHVMRYLRNQGWEIPIIFCTRVGTLRTSRQATEAGAYTYYDKADLLANPHWVLYPLTDGVRDMAYVRRECQRLRLDTAGFVQQWLVGQRPIWGRQWTGIVTTCLEALAAQGAVHLSPREIDQFELGILPGVLREFQEPTRPDDLLAFLSRRGFACVDARRCKPFWLITTEDPSCPRLLVLDPADQHRNPRPPGGWAESTRQWHRKHPAVVPVDLRSWSVGAVDPYWGVEQVFALCPEVSEGLPDLAEFSAFPSKSGRIGQLGPDRWDQLAEICEDLQQAEDFLARATSIASAYFLNPRVEPDSPTEGSDGLPCAVVPIPDGLIHPEIVQKESGGPLVQLLRLHSTSTPSEESADEVRQRLQLVSRVTVYRGPSANAFEEQVLQVVLQTLSQVLQRASGPWFVWLGCDVLHVRSSQSRRGPRLNVWPREVDVLILGPPGICVLECKDSLKPSDLNRGRDQLIDLRQVVWCGLDRRQHWGGVYLLPVLEHRLAGMGRHSQVPDDVLQAVPARLADAVTPLRGRQSVLNEIRNFYRPLEQVFVNPGQTLRRQDFNLARNRISAVIGYVVVPDDFDRRGRAGIAPYIQRLQRDLPQVLQKWATLPAAFTDDGTSQSAFSVVREALHDLALTPTRPGLQQVYGFAPEETEPDLLDGWQVLSGQAELTQQQQTVLVHTFTRSPTRAHLHGYGPWRATGLRDLSCEFRWLDVRGLPPVEQRHVRRLAIVAQGRLGDADAISQWDPGSRLVAIEALWRLGAEPAVSGVLGESSNLPQPLAQQLMPGQAWRFAWLPGHPPPPTKGQSGERPEFVLAPLHIQRRGLDYVLTALLSLLSDLEDPILKRVREILAEAQAALKERNTPLPNTNALGESVAAASRLFQVSVSTATAPS